MVLRYTGVWLALLALTVVTYAVSRVPLGPFHLAAAMLIALVKAGLVAMFFMHLRHSHGTFKLAVGVACFFIALLGALMVADLATRAPMTNPPVERATPG
jgi:cytochrome c oxidase subunit 4